MHSGPLVHRAKHPATLTGQESYGALVAQVDWSSLRRESGSVVDPELTESQSDLLFSARLLGGQPLLLYLLLEHQSTVDPWMALRMLRYVVRHLQHWRKEHPSGHCASVSHWLSLQ